VDISPLAFPDVSRRQSPGFRHDVLAGCFSEGARFDSGHLGCGRSPSDAHFVREDCFGGRSVGIFDFICTMRNSPSHLPEPKPIGAVSPLSRATSLRAARLIWWLSLLRT